MRHWNYRLLSEVTGDYTTYFVAEVYYDDAGNPKAWTDREEFNPLGGYDNEQDLRYAITHVQDALRKPVLRVMGNKLVE